MTGEMEKGRRGEKGEMWVGGADTILSVPVGREGRGGVLKNTVFLYRWVGKKKGEMIMFLTCKKVSFF